MAFEAIYEGSNPSPPGFGIRTDFRFSKEAGFSFSGAYPFFTIDNCTGAFLQSGAFVKFCCSTKESLI